MKKILFIFFILGFVFASCATYTIPELVPEDSVLANSNLRVQVLGPVSVSYLDNSMKSYFSRGLGVRELLLEEALKLYPDARYVTNITVTGVYKESFFSKPALKGYILEGLALSY